MVVVYDRDACVQMYYLLKEKLGKDSIEVIMNVDRAPIEVTDGNKNGKLNKDWRRWKEELKLPIEKDDFERWQKLMLIVKRKKIF